ncbi:MAG: hypothetical protein ACRD2E_10835 [Terriglobales bacterium]
MSNYGLDPDGRLHPVAAPAAAIPRASQGSQHCRSRTRLHAGFQLSRLLRRFSAEVVENPDILPN